MGTLFEDRFDAGRILAKQLCHHAGNPSVLVLALPRGGVPVAFEIAQALDAPLDVFIVRKLGVPGCEELAMGAIASGGVRVLNEDVIRQLNIPESAIEVVAAEEAQELSRREKMYRGDREPVQIQQRTVILVDDGLATGASMRAAVRALRRQNPASITVAVPVASREICNKLRAEVDELVCGVTPEPFYAVGTWYSNFIQTTDEEVGHLLDQAAEERRTRRAPGPMEKFPAR
jgi:putative phosphoribosyl transferase